MSPADVLAPLVCFALALGFAQTDWFQSLENSTLDLRTRWRTQWFPTQPRDDVVLVGIDQPSLEQAPKGFGRWPWDRRVHGNFMRLMGQVKPSVVAWDILFDDPVEQDAALAEGIRRSGVATVLGGNRADADLGLKPGAEAAGRMKLRPLARVSGDRAAIPGAATMSVPRGLLGELADIGFVDTPPGPDGVRRVAPLVVRIGDQVYPTLALRSLLYHWHVEPEQIEVKLGDAVVIANSFVSRRIPIDATGGYLINYRHALGGFRTSGYAETFAFLKARFVDKKDVPVPELTGRIALIGQTADGLADFGPSPFSALTPLVLVHANVLENVLNDDFARHASPWPIWLGGLALTAASIVFLERRLFRQQVLAALGLPLIFGLAASLCWFQWSLWVPFAWPVLGFLATHAFSVGRRVLAEQRAKEQIKGMFGNYLAPALVNRMAASGVAPQLGGHEEEITAFFSDIQGYSTFSEKLPAKQLVDLLNDYLTACTDIVQQEGGTLDKYIGDAIVAMYGAPLPLRDHAYRACASALRVQAALGNLRAKWREEGERWPDGVRHMRSRIGLNTGSAVIGNMGSRSRFNYTMTGDNVNLAARMESGAKQWGVFIMVTDSTRLACEQHAPGRILFRPLGRIVVKGRTQAVPLFEVFAFADEATLSMRECITTFAAGLDRYYARDWDGAIACFERSRECEPYQPTRDGGVSSNPSIIYLELAGAARSDPPPADWDGVFKMSEK